MKKSLVILLVCLSLVTLIASTCFAKAGDGRGPIKLGTAYDDTIVGIPHEPAPYDPSKPVGQTYRTSFLEARDLFMGHGK